MGETQMRRGMERLTEERETGENARVRKKNRLSEMLL